MVKTFLVGDYADTTVTARQWYEAYHLAQRFGWRPAGTVLRGCIFECPCMHAGTTLCKSCERAAYTWAGCYLARRGQIVTEEDGVKLASALRTAIDQVPDDAPPWRYAKLGAPETLPAFERLTEDLLGYWATQVHGHDLLWSIETVASSGDFRIHGKL